jgi:hypothetical protein
VKSRYPDGHPFYGVGPEDGVHVLRNRWGQRSYVGEQSSALASGIEAAVQATRLVVPRRPARGKDFRIDPSTHGMRLGIDKIDAASEERRMEQLLYLAYGPEGNLRSTDAWGRLIAFQVPLYDQRDRKGWGHIDLMALTLDGHPAVIELKKQDAQETPLRALLEGVANAVTVEENWPSIAAEIRAMCAARGLEARVAERASPVTVVVLAPESYWRSWQQDGVYGQAVGQEARDGFRRLRAALAEAGTPTQLATFDWPFDRDPHVRAAKVNW